MTAVRTMVWAVALGLGAFATRLDAQTNAVSAAMDYQVSRARALLENGDGAEARTVLDSLVASAPTASFDLAEALFWRAALAERIADAERDWQRLVIEAPLSPRTPDALVRLGELELLRAHPKEARVWFQRVVQEFPSGGPSAKSALLIARSWFDENDTVQGCAALADARARSVPDGELGLQAADMAKRCATGASPAAPPAARPAARAAARAAAPAAAPSAAPAAAPTGGGFSVQLAAYNTKREADAAVARLAQRGLDVRVDGDVKPFRVRSGRYTTRAQAAAALAALKAKGIDGFVAELAP